MSERGVRMRAGPSGMIHGDLVLPDNPCGLVVFAHGSGSSRRSPRKRSVAETLQRRGLGTLLFDLLTDTEEAIDQQSGQLRFDIDLLAQRLGLAVDFIIDDASTSSLPIGLFATHLPAEASPRHEARR
jgi:hypothetical protein